MKNRYNSVKFLERSKNNFLSVIIPVYKDVGGLGETIGSLYKQSLGKSKFEIIVANDGGDKSVENLCMELKVFCLSIQPRKGSYNARNVALEHSKGGFLAFIDAGTIADSSWLKKGFIVLQRYDYVGGPVEIIKNPKDKVSNYLFLYQKATAFDVKKYMTNLYFSPTTNLFIKREVIERLGGFDRRLQSAGDWELGDRVANSGSFSQKYVRDVKVYHHARSYRSLLKKIERVSGGQAKLVKLYPARFKTGGGNILVAVVKVMFGPLTLLSKPSMISVPTVKKVGVIIFAYYIGAISIFRYISHLKFIGTKTTDLS